MIIVHLKNQFAVYISLNYSLLLSITILAYLILSSCNIQKREEPQKISNSKVIKDELKNLKIEKESASTELTFKVPPMPAAPEAFIFKVPPMPIIPESISSSNKSIFLKAIPLSGEETLKFLDVRGVGDSGMGYTHTQPYKLTDKVLGVNADFAERLDEFDPTGKSYRGDLSFINWESSVGTDCKEFWAPRNGGAFAFMSHPDNLIKAYQKGFNLIGLANNHTRDCPCADNWENGALVSANHMKRLTEELKANWLWHGVGTEKTANIKTFDIKGGKIKVAFANIYMGGGDCSYICCQSDELIVLNSLRDADANLRILSIHSWNAETHKQLIETGVQFIKYYKGDIVFGNGPHSVEPVKIIESPITGKTGVMFESLGNFIHPSLKANSNHIIGRVLFDLDIIKLRQIQVIPIAVNRVTVSFNAIDPLTVPANFTWNKVGDSDWQSGFNTTIQGAYYNLVSANGH